MNNTIDFKTTKTIDTMSKKIPECAAIPVTRRYGSSTTT